MSIIFNHNNVNVVDLSIIDLTIIDCNWYNQELPGSCIKENLIR